MDEVVIDQKICILLNRWGSTKGRSNRLSSGGGDVCIHWWWRMVAITRDLLILARFGVVHWNKS